MVSSIVFSFQKVREHMLPLSKSWWYWALVLLFISQVVLSVNYHILICNIPIANTLLLLIIMAHHGYALDEQARLLFLRICGCVAYIAVLFVNTTHALELMSPISDDHGHSHGTSAVNTSEEYDQNHSIILMNNATDKLDHHHHEERSFQIVPKSYFICSIFDVVLKCFVLAVGHVPHMGLHPIPRTILHTLSPAVVIIIYTVGHYIPPSIGNSWLWGHCDPLTAVCMTVLFFTLIYPAFREMLPYLFADTPAKFQVDTFQDDISSKFPEVTCTHIHAYRLWPGNKFEALIHVNIKVDKSNPKWSDNAEARVFEIRQSVNTTLSEAGAQKVVVEPRFVDVNMQNEPWLGCVAENCFKSDRGCCKGDETEDITSP